MSDFPSGAICVVGLAKVANQNPIHSVHRALAGSFIVDPSSGLVYDVQFDTVCQITSDFLASLLIGLSLHTDLEEMIRKRWNWNGVFRSWSVRRRKSVRRGKTARNNFG